MLEGILDPALCFLARAELHHPFSARLRLFTHGNVEVRAVPAELPHMNNHSPPLVFRRHNSKVR